MINGFTLHDTSNAPPASAEILNSVQRTWDFVPNLHRVLAESPAAIETYTVLWGIAKKTGFTPQERNIVHLAIIYENESTYCMAGHTNLSWYLPLPSLSLTNHLAQTPNDAFMNDAEWNAPGRLKPAA